MTCSTPIYDHHLSSLVIYLILRAFWLLVALCSMNTDDLKKILGRRIAEVRKSQGLSQDKLCLMIGFGHTYLVDVENGRRNIGFDNLCKIASGLGMTVSQLLDIDEFNRVSSKAKE